MKHTATQALVTIAVALAIVVAVKVIQPRAAEILFAVMNDEAGKVSAHQVNLRDGSCVALVKKFTEQAKSGMPITLTLPSPTFTGTVIEAYCVMPPRRRTFAAQMIGERVMSPFASVTKQDCVLASKMVALWVAFWGSAVYLVYAAWTAFA